MNGSMLTLGHRLWGDGSGLAKIAFSTHAWPQHTRTHSRVRSEKREKAANLDHGAEKFDMLRGDNARGVFDTETAKLFQAQGCT
jgi:hypothetical protein